MNKKILILAITASFIISSIPLAEASIGWNGFLRDIGFGGSQIYEVSEDFVFPELTALGSPVQLRCLDGDWLYTGATPIIVTVDQSLDTTNLNVGLRDITQITETSAGSATPKQIGYIATPEQIGAMQLFEIPVTLTILCFSPSPLSNSATVGGDWQATDTVALFIGYSVLNAYWLAPTLTGIGAGVYLTKSKWKKF